MKDCIKPTVVIPRNGDLSDELDKMGIGYYIIKLSRAKPLYILIDVTPYFMQNSFFTHSEIVSNFFALRNNLLAAIEIKKIIENENIELLHINSSVCNAGAMGAPLRGITTVGFMQSFI